jgi:hypothetical protein
MLSALTSTVIVVERPDARRRACHRSPCTTRPAVDVHRLRLLLIPQISQTQIKMPAAMTASATQSCQLSGGTICSS